MSAKILTGIFFTVKCNWRMLTFRNRIEIADYQQLEVKNAELILAGVFRINYF